VIVENGVRNPDGTWQKDANNNFVRNPDLVDPQIKRIADKFRQLAAPAANRVIGSIATSIPVDQNAAGESALGDVVADGMLRRTASAGAQLALMNIGGLRASLNYAGPNKNPGEVTFGECFAVQPFGNVLLTKTFTGAQIKDVLEQQFRGYAGQDTTRFLQVSASLSYSYDTTLPLGGRISDVRLNGVPIDPATKYRVTINDFLANPPGGDGFSGLAGGVDPDQTVIQPDLDIDSLVAYLSTGPIPPGPQDRIHKIA
jgi:5'-nucleotidase